MKIIIGYYDSGYWWEILIENCDIKTHYTREESTELSITIIYNYEKMNHVEFVEWLYAKGYKEIIICNNGLIDYYKKEE